MTAGAAWKARREALGKSVEDVSAVLRISPKYIEAIEAGCFEGWPARVFAQGFIRSYASLLGEDPEPLLAEYASQQAEEAAPDGPPPARPFPLWREEETGRGRRTALYGAVALVILAAAALVNFVAGRADRALPPPAPAVLPPAAPAPPEAPADNGTAAPPAGAGDNMSAQVVAPPPQPASPDAQRPAEEGYAPVPAAGPYHLLLEAAEETWVAWSVDDGKSSEATLSPGEKLNVPARTRVRLRLGNAGGVAPSINGKRVAPFGKRGQVVSVIIGPPPPPGTEPAPRRSPAKPPAPAAARPATAIPPVTVAPPPVDPGAERPFTPPLKYPGGR